MQKLSEYINKILDDRSVYWPIRVYKADQVDEMYEYFDGQVPQGLEDRLISGEKFEDLMLEHLRNIDSKYIIKDLQEYFKWCYDVEEFDDVIQLFTTKDPRNDEDFIKLMDIYQYNIKSSRMYPDGIYKVHIEKNFPEDVSEKVNYYPEDRFVFHITKNHMWIPY